jgi:hypothetical protein
MQYMLMFVRDDESWEALSAEEQDYPTILAWWAQLVERGILRGGGELQPARTATTVSNLGGAPVITDGPFMETKESVGGFGIIEVDNLDEAIDIARSWPARDHLVEIRPMVVR